MRPTRIAVRRADFAFAMRGQQNRSFYSVANIVENGDEDFLQRLGLGPGGRWSR